ncbi:MAG: hypothetical protein OHK0053_36140 [Microscillaceae bacterium]
MKKFALLFLLFLAFACGSVEKGEKEAQDTTLPKKVGEKSTSPAEKTATSKVDFSAFLGKILV